MRTDPWQYPFFGDRCPPFRVGVMGIGSERCGATPLWNGVFSAAQLRMRKLPGRKAMIVLSDGYDTGSQHSLNDAIEAAQGADASVYSIYSPMPALFRFMPGMPMIKSMKSRGGLKELAEDTGGRFYNAGDDLASVFAQIEAELRSLYVLGFVLPEDARDGKFHKLEVKTTRKDARVRARRGYTAKKP